MHTRHTPGLYGGQAVETYVQHLFLSPMNIWKVILVTANIMGTDCVDLFYSILKLQSLKYDCT